MTESVAATSPQSPPLHVVVLAAGQGKRMHSRLPKVLQPVGGQTMLHHVLSLADQLGPSSIHVVYGHQGEVVQQAFAQWAGTPLQWALQEQQQGTGDAVNSAMPQIPDHAKVLVLYGDAPLMDLGDLQALRASTDALTILSSQVDKPHGYGRMVRDEQGTLRAIVEEKDASEEQRRITEINTGVLSADAKALRRWLSQITNDNAQGEYLLTDVVGLAVAENASLNAIVAPDADSCLGANDRQQLAVLEQQFQQRCRQQLMQQGVRFADPNSVHIRGNVRVAQDVFIDINVVLEGDIELGNDVQIGPGCVIRDSSLAPGTVVHPHSILEQARTTGACQIGPFARLRPGSELSAGCKVGNFVEMKKSRLGLGSKVSHLSYIGDSVVGSHVNIGAGTITCNYDGVNKHKTTIEDGAFIGSNTALVAPVTIGENGLVGAGSIITQDVPENQLAVARSRQRNISRRKRSS